VNYITFFCKCITHSENNILTFVLRKTNRVMPNTIQTSDHKVIQLWIEQRNGQPAVINETTNDNVTGVLRIKFQDDTSNLKVISWEEFFKEFDDNEMMFLFSDGSGDCFNKFVYESNGD